MKSKICEGNNWRWRLFKFNRDERFLSKRNFQFTLLILASVFVSSCITKKQVTYFNDIETAEFVSQVEDLEPVIRKK